MCACVINNYYYWSLLYIVLFSTLSQAHCTCLMFFACIQDAVFNVSVIQRTVPCFYPVQDCRQDVHLCVLWIILVLLHCVTVTMFSFILRTPEHPQTYHHCSVPLTVFSSTITGSSNDNIIMNGPLPLTIFSSTMTVYSSNNMNHPFH